MKPSIFWNIAWFLYLYDSAKYEGRRSWVLKESLTPHSFERKQDLKFTKFGKENFSILISIFTQLGGHILDGVCPASVQLENQDLEWCLDVTKANYMKLREGPQVIEANPWRQSKASKWWPWRRMFRHLRFQPIKIELVRLWSCKVYNLNRS